MGRSDRFNIGLTRNVVHSKIKKLFRAYGLNILNISPVLYVVDTEMGFRTSTVEFLFSAGVSLPTPSTVTSGLEVVGPSCGTDFMVTESL